MEACLHFASRLVRERTKSFKFVGNSGIRWILKQHGLDGGYLTQKITIHKLDKDIHMLYYADLELYAFNGELVTEETFRDSFPTILIDFKPETVLKILEENFLIEEGETNPKLLFKVELHPILEFEDYEAFSRTLDIKESGRQSVVRGVASLIRDPKLEHLYDVIVVLDNVKVKAHKCVLSARMPELYNITSKIKGRRMVEDNLEVVELKGSEMIRDTLEFTELRKFAAAGLPDMIRFLYSTEYPDKLVTIGNLSITAKVIGSTFYQRMFLEKCMEKLTPETVLYMIYLTELNKIPENIEKTMEFFIRNEGCIKKTTAWLCYETFSNNLCRKSKQHKYSIGLDFQTLQLAYEKVLKQIYELQNF